jgi:hypothetical protein
MLGVIKQFGFGIVFLLLVKGLVYIGLINVNELNNPIAIQIDLKGLELLNLEDQSNLFEIVDGTAEINGKFFREFELVKINGKIYVVDIGIKKASLHEYSLIQRIKRNFHLLESEPKFAWAYYLRVITVVIAFFFFIFPEHGFLNGSFLLLLQIAFLTIPLFLIVGLLGWVGWFGFFIYIMFLLTDIFIGSRLGQE